MPEHPVATLLPAIRMFHYRWSVPTVARLYRDGPQRPIDLHHAFGASRDTLTDTLRRLEQAGLIVRKPTPGGITCFLTPAGQAVGAACIDAVEAVRAAGLVELALKKWPMLVLVAIGRGASRYTQVRAALPGITPRALTIALKDLQAAGLIERTIEHSYPPTAIYALSPAGAGLFPVMDALCTAAERATESEG